MVWGKHDAQRTNKGNINGFNKQLTQRVYEQYVMHRAQIGMDLISKKMTSHEDATEEITKTSFMVGRPKYKVYLQRRESQHTHAEEFFLQAEWQNNKNKLAQSHCRSLVYLCFLKSISLRTKIICFNLSAFEYKSVSLNTSREARLLNLIQITRTMVRIMIGP
jgi:hypothetical protein